MVVKEPYEDHGLGIEIEKIKHSLGIEKPNSKLDDVEIQAIVKQFGERGPDNMHDENGETVFGPESISYMLCISLYYFPKYYEKFHLSQPQ
jgi:hypothetical protein